MEALIDQFERPPVDTIPLTRAAVLHAVEYASIYGNRQELHQPLHHDCYRVGLDAHGGFVPPHEVNAYLTALGTRALMAWAQVLGRKVLDVTNPQNANVGVGALHVYDARAPNYQTLRLATIVLPAVPDLYFLPVPSHDLHQGSMAGITLVDYLVFLMYNDGPHMDVLGVAQSGHLNQMKVVVSNGVSARHLAQGPLDELAMLYAHLVG